MADQDWSTIKHQLQAVLRSGALGSLSDSQLLLRFLDGGDPAAQAFEILVARHGPMVQSVCRQILGTTHDADDAFQATFLVLVKRAHSIRNRDSVASWLHGVARRIALRARQHTKTRRLVPLGDTPAESTDALGQSELVVSVHEEIARLPEHYRVPVLLCEIGGQTHAQAAAQLNCPIGTVSGRLSRAKTLLKERIARRGIVASTVALTAALSARPARADLVLAARRGADILRAAGTHASRGETLAKTYLATRLTLSVQWATACLLTATIGAAGWIGFQKTEHSSPVPVASTQERSSTTVAADPISTSEKSATVDGKQLLADAGRIIAAAIAPDGKSFALIRSNAFITLWDVESNKERLTFRGHKAPILSLAFSADGRSITTSDSEQMMKVWTTASGHEELSMRVPLSRTVQTALAEPASSRIPSGS